MSAVPSSEKHIVLIKMKVLKKIDVTMLTYSTLFFILSWASVVLGKTTFSRTFDRSKSCDHLQNDGTQHNAYSHSLLGGGFCCFCPRSTYWVGDCDPKKPSSTQCKKCGPDHYMHFEPHLEQKCYPKRERFCHPPKVYYKGTSAEMDRCVCPHGMKEDQTTDECKAVVSPTKTHSEVGTSTTSTTVKDLPRTHSDSPKRVATTISKPSPKDPAKPSPTDPPLPVTTASPLKTTTTDTKTATTNEDPLVRLRSTKEKSKVQNKTFQPAVISIIVIAVIVTIVLLAILWYKKKNKNSNTNAKLNDGFSAETVEIALSDEPKGPPINPETVLSYEEQPLMPNFDGNRRCSRNDDVCQSESSPRSRLNPSREELREKANKILPENYATFAREIAKGIGYICIRDKAIEIARSIVGNNDDNELDDIFRIHHGNTKELFYQAMELAIRFKGMELSPFYIWEKVNCCNYRQYSEIVEKEIEIECPKQCNDGRQQLETAKS